LWPAPQQELAVKFAACLAVCPRPLPSAVVGVTVSKYTERAFIDTSSPPILIVRQVVHDKFPH
jgi:hypothetical protein